jgi:hypothetical protein
MLAGRAVPCAGRWLWEVWLPWDSIYNVGHGQADTEAEARLAADEALIQICCAGPTPPLEAA